MLIYNKLIPQKLYASRGLYNITPSIPKTLIITMKRNKKRN